MPRRTDLVLAPAQPLAELVERAQAYTADARATSTRKTLHKGEEVARAYIRHAKLFDENAAAGLA